MATSEGASRLPVATVLELKTLRQSFAAAEHAPRHRTDAGEAVDLIITDLSMPGMDGVTLMQKAQRHRARLSAILLTGYDTNAAEIAIAGAVSGCFTLPREPISGKVLVERVAMLLEGATRTH